MFSSDLANELGGRYVEFRIYSLSYLEFLQFHKLPTVELSSPETIAHEFGNLLKIKDNYPKIVVSGERSFEDSYNGVEHVYIRDFLSSTLGNTRLSLR